MNENTPVPNDPELDETPSEDFAKALQAYESGPQSAAAPSDATRDLSVGDKVRGRVISIGDAHLLVDYGGSSEGIAGDRAWGNDDGKVRVGVGGELEMWVV